jgi:hypothetical protein
MAEDFPITEQIKRRIEKDTLMSALGIKQLLDGTPITSAEDRKAVTGLIFYLYGRGDRCPPPPPITRRPSMHDS